MPIRRMLTPQVKRRFKNPEDIDPFIVLVLVDSLLNQKTVLAHGRKTKTNESSQTDFATV